MFYKIENNRYVAESDTHQQNWYQSTSRIDCTQYMPDANGNPVLIPLPVVPEPEPYIPTAEEIKQSLINAVQSHLDATARAKGYDGILSAVSYAGDAIVPQFDIEGQSYKTWRSQVWAFCYAYLADVQEGTKEVPTASELIALLPTPPEPIQWVVYGNNA